MEKSLLMKENTLIQTHLTEMFTFTAKNKKFLNYKVTKPIQHLSFDTFFSPALKYLPYKTAFYHYLKTSLIFTVEANSAKRARKTLVTARLGSICFPLWSVVCRIDTFFCFPVSRPTGQPTSQPPPFCYHCTHGLVFIASRSAKTQRKV